MNKIGKGLLFALLSLSLFSCDEDTTQDPDAPKPTITVEELNSGAVNQDITVTSSDVLKFKWNALRTGAGAKLDMFEVYQNGVNVMSPLPQTALGEDLPITNMPIKYESQYVDTLTIPAGQNDGITTYSFVVTDKDGNQVSQDISVTVQNITPLATVKNGSFYHIGGSLEGAYDLVNDQLVALSGANADKDLMNTDNTGNNFTGSFKSANKTEFAKVTNFNYGQASVESATNAFNASSSSQSISNPAVGDIYIAKLRQGNEIVVIKITAVDPADNTCNCGNTGKITFEYKKK